jgi:parvulin-like peptidyl-prolyl isomerase
MTGERDALRTGLLVLVASGFAPLTVEAQIDIVEQAVVVVNGDPVTKTSIDERIRVTRALQGTAAADVDLLPQILSDAIDEILMTQRARELGLSVADEDVDRVIANVRSESGATNEQAFHELLQREGITAAAFRASIRRQLTIELVRQRVARSVTVSDLEAQRYFEAHKGVIGSERRVIFRELCLDIPPPGAVSDVERDRAIVRVVRVGDKLAAGADFAELVRQSSDPSSKETEGLVGPTGISTLKAPIREALVRLRRGQTSGPVMTDAKYCFLKLEGDEPATPRTFRANRDAVVQQLLAEKQRAAIQRLLHGLRASAFIQWKRSDFRALYERTASYR